MLKYPQGIFGVSEVPLLACVSLGKLYCTSTQTSAPTIVTLFSMKYHALVLVFVKMETESTVVIYLSIIRSVYEGQVIIIIQHHTTITPLCLCVSVCARPYARHRGVQRPGAWRCSIRDARRTREIHCGAL